MKLILVGATLGGTAWLVSVIGDYFAAVFWVE
jgi:hypothetical protein